MLMDKRSKYLLWSFGLLTLVVALWGYRSIFIERNFAIQSTTSCDPQTEICFMQCTDNACEEDYYKKITKNAKNIPVCNGVAEACAPLACEPGELNCEITPCTSDSVEEGERCTNPYNFMMKMEKTESASTTTAL